MTDRKGEQAPIETDISSLSPALSGEIVTDGELSTMILMAENVLRIGGQDSTVNGIPARVSSESAPVVLAGKHYYTRVFKLKSKDEDTVVPGIVFDETPEVEVLTPNLLAVHFTSSTSHPALVIDHDLEPRVNDHQDVELIKKLLIEISQKTTRAAAEKATAAKRAEEQALAIRRNNRHEWAETMKRWGIRTAKIAGALALCGAVSGGVVLGARQIDWHAITRGHDGLFDERNFDLPGGTVIVPGETKAPQFSPELYDNPDLKTTEVPPASTGTLDTQDTLRQVVLTSPEGKSHCQDITVAKVPLGTKLFAWTDFVDAAGKSRADQLAVKYEVDNVNICWNGQEINPQDDPRVLIRLRLP